MTDLTLAATVTRTSLGLADLNINDHTNYYLASELFGGAQSWNRNSVSSPYMDGEVVISRRRELVTDRIVVEARGSSAANLQTALSTVIAAFSQDTFYLDIIFNGVEHKWLCEAADYAMTVTGPRIIAKQVQVAFSVRRMPVAEIGVW